MPTTPGSINTQKLDVSQFVFEAGHLFLTKSELFQASAQGRKLRRQEASNMEETNHQVGREESAPSSSGKNPPHKYRIRVSARLASQLFDLTKRLGFKRDGITVEWLIKQFESDQDPGKFSSVDELTIDFPQDMKRRPQPGMTQLRKDKHRLTEDGRDRRVRVPRTCLSQLIHLTQKLPVYCLSRCIRPQ